MLLIILKNVKIKVIRGKELRACCGGFYVVVITYTWTMRSGLLCNASTVDNKYLITPNIVPVVGERFVKKQLR